MIYYKEYSGHSPKVEGKRKKVDNTIYTFDIETTSYLILNGIQLSGIEYQNLTKEQQEDCDFYSCMYIWMFSIDDVVYYGRTWEEFKKFLDKVEENSPYPKILFIHNLAFEFQYLKSVFNFTDVMARKSRKVMRCNFEDYNFELRCSYMMSNCALKYLPGLYNLPVEKKVGELDYTKIRTSITKLTENELIYCEYDCLVVYHYILRELETYERVDKIPLTSTGHVRRELKERVNTDFEYKRKLYKAINSDPHVYNLLTDAFAGGYTHANWIYADEVLKDVDSWDFTSSYPYVLVTHQYPSTEFKKCNVSKRENMSKRLAYLLVVRFTNLKCKYYNTFISQSKCRNIYGGRYDNGRIIQADSLEITLTDIDFYFILDTYNCDYEILECYYSKYNYLPNQFIEFVLEKYVNKTKYKNVEGKEVEYTKEKNKFNALYGMSVTNMIRDEVIYDNESGWSEKKLSNDEIIDSLEKEKKKSFLSFAYGVWVTAYARNNLLRNLIKLDEYVIYSDTDSLKLLNGYNKDIITNYNDFVKNKIEKISKILKIEIDKFAPTDVFGNSHMLGLFDADGHYEEFITQGAKKYAYTKWVSKDKVKKDTNIIKEENDKCLVLEITVAGVPKSGANALKDIKDFKDDLVFEFKDTNKNLIFYCEEQKEVDLIDYQGNKYKVNDKTGCCIVPTTYVLGKALEYAELISDNSSHRAIYNEKEGVS